MDRKELISLIEENSFEDFEYVAIQLFHYQYKHNVIYRNWVDHLRLDPRAVISVNHIPFLPISAFKQYKLHCEQKEEEAIFTSSGTTGSIPSKHFVFDMSHYLDRAQSIFESFYGQIEDYCFLALLPSYLERSGSSLVAMVDYFIKNSNYKESGFYLDEYDALCQQLLKCKEAKIPTILFGVSFALIDFIEQYPIVFPELVVIETGGMKGRKKEITREELHGLISKGFGVKYVHSEYGMTELFSQAYSKENGIFYPGKTLAVYIKDITDPLQLMEDGRPGIINIIDLANIDTCAFIETQDLGKKYKDGSFEILGRLDTSEMRGCNLMVGDV